jgi:hypothetical protein
MLAILHPHTPSRHRILKLQVKFEHLIQLKILKVLTLQCYQQKLQTEQAVKLVALIILPQSPLPYTSLPICCVDSLTTTSVFSA